MPTDPSPPRRRARRPPSALTIELRDGQLALAAPELPVAIAGASLSLTVRRGGRRLSWRADHLTAADGCVEATWAETGLRVELRWAEHGSGLCLSALLELRGEEPLELEEVGVLVAEGPAALRVGEDAGDWSVYRNGYQSWSGTRAYRVGEADRDPWLPFLRDALIDVGHPAAGQAGVVRSDLVTAIVDLRGGAALALGFLDAREHFGAVAVEAPGGRVRRLAAVVDGDRRPLRHGERLELPRLWLAAGEDGEALLAAWAATCGTAMQARHTGRAPIGWCSWYYYFTKVTEADVLANLEALQRLRGRVACDYVMIDDGYQRAIGDWLEPNAKFPHGMRWLAQQIRAAGFDAGIWMAPFIARPESQLFRARPQWFVRTERGRARSGSWNPMWSLGRPAYALDTTHPEVLEWLRELARTVVHQWGFRILKLDFLYAAALPGVHHDPAATRAQAVRRGLEAIREGAGDDAFLLGCGCPLGPAIGIVDGMRIGADVAPYWTNWLSRGLMQDRHGVATKHAIRNILTRAFMHRRLWLNDPDCLMVRASETKLTRDEVQSLAAAIALTDGMFVLSDRIDALPPERLALIEQALQFAGGAARVTDLFERDLPEMLRCAHPGGEILAVFNFRDTPVDRVVALRPYRGTVVRELWSGDDLPVRDGRVELKGLPAHGCRLLWLGRVDTPDEAAEGIDHLDQ